MTTCGRSLRNDSRQMAFPWMSFAAGSPAKAFSAAGAGRGLDDPRSGLWSEYARIVREIGPDWVIVENSPRLRTRGADRVLSDLEEADYACMPCVVGAANAGAPHRRSRVWILAYANGLREPQPRRSQPEQRGWLGDGGKEVSAYADGPRLEIVQHGASRECTPAIGTRQWSAEPCVGRMAYGISDRTHRIKALGNAVVPQIPEAIGRAILAAEASQALRRRVVGAHHG